MTIIEYNGKKPRVGHNVMLAPNAVLIGDVTVEDGASIWFGAVLRGDFGKIVVGRGSCIQDNAVVHVMPDCETVVEENVTVAHGVVLHGCRIKRGATIGMGSVVQDFCEIGEQAMVAAGSVIPTNMVVPDRHLAAGVPAKVKKKIDGPSLMWVAASSPMYNELAQSYLRQGIGRHK